MNVIVDVIGINELFLSDIRQLLVVLKPLKLLSELTRSKCGEILIPLLQRSPHFPSVGQQKLFLMLKRRLNRIVHVVHLLLVGLVDLLLHGDIKSVIAGSVSIILWPCK